MTRALTAAWLVVVIAGCDRSGTTPLGPSREPPAPPVAAPAPPPPPAPSPAALNLAGRYTFRFSADTTCGELPPDLRTRRYDGLVKVEPANGDLFSVELTGAAFYPEYDTMWGNVRGDELTFFVSSWDAMNRWLDDLPIIERLDGGRSLSLMGTVKGARLPIDRTAVEFLAALDGVFSYCAATNPQEAPFAPCPVAAASCTSAHHRLTFARRGE